MQRCESGTHLAATIVHLAHVPKKFMIKIITYTHLDNAIDLNNRISSKGGIPCKNQYSIRERKFRGMQD